MQNSLMTFNFDGVTVRTVTGSDGETWFVAADALHALTLDRKALERLDEEDKGVAEFGTTGGPQRLSVVSEMGLYFLVMGSRKSSSKKLKHEVLRQVSDSRAVVKAMAEFEVPDDIPDMHVYAIVNTVTGNVKIGISRDPEARLRQLQSGNDCRLVLAATRPAYSRFADESGLHKAHAANRIRGEWFSVDAISALEVVQK